MPFPPATPFLRDLAMEAVKLGGDRTTEALKTSNLRGHGNLINTAFPARRPLFTGLAIVLSRWRRPEVEAVKDAQTCGAWKWISCLSLHEDTPFMGYVDRTV